MNRKITLLCTTLLLLIAVALFPACQKVNDGIEPVVINLEGVAVAEGDTLLDVMQERQEEKRFSFKMANGMITEFNGTANTVNSYWMLYTSDTDSAISNAAWGTYVYEGRTLASAALGAESLLVKTGEIYVWVYTTF